MDRLNFKPRLESLKRPQKSSTARFSYQALAEEVATKYNAKWKEFIWLFYKVPEHLIRQAMKEASTINEMIRYAMQLNKH